MTDTAEKFVAQLKGENVLDAMNVIKEALTERSKVVIGTTRTEVATSFKLTEKAAPVEKKDDEEVDENGEKKTKKDDEKEGM